MDSSATFGRLVVAFLAIIALLQVIALLGTEPEPSVQDGSEWTLVSDRLQRLEALALRRAETLERIETELAIREPRSEPASSVVATPTSIAVAAPLTEQVVPESLAELVRSLDALRASFERESAATQEVLRDSTRSGEESMVEMRQRKTEPDWYALELLESSYRADAEATNRSQHFLTPKDLLRIYGPPTAIYRPSGGINFSYKRTDPGSPTLSFVIQDGFVVRFFVKD